MSTKRPDEKYSDQEAQARFKSALLGARAAGHKPMESLTRTKAKKQPSKRKKTGTKNAG
jgi:hypothetical protein